MLPIAEYRYQCNTVGPIRSSQDFDLFIAFQWLPNWKIVFLSFSCSTTAHHRSSYRYSNCFMVLLNQRTYYESCPIRGTMSTFGSGNSRDSNPAQLSTIRFNDSRTFMETWLHGNSQVESSKHNHKKDRQSSMEMEVDIGSHNTVWGKTAEQGKIQLHGLYDDESSCHWISE